MLMLVMRMKWNRGRLGVAAGSPAEDRLEYLAATTSDAAAGAARVAEVVFGGLRAEWEARLTSAALSQGTWMVVARDQGVTVGYGKARWGTPKGSDGGVPVG